MIVLCSAALLVSGCATSHSTATALPRDAVFISIAPDGTFYLSDIVTLGPNGTPYQPGQHLDFAALSVKLNELGAQHPNLSVQIVVAKDTKQRHITAVTKAGKAAGLKDIEICPVWKPEVEGAKPR